MRARPDLLGGLWLNPDLPVPPGLPQAPILEAADLGACRVFHVIAPFEMEAGLDTLWPPTAALGGGALVVTLHDLIPRVFPSHYHADLGTRRRYLAREELVRAADRVLAVSEATRAEAIALLDLPPKRVTVIGAGVGAGFGPTASAADALLRAQAAVPGLEPGFLFSVAGIDYRKNIEGLLQAYALLGPAFVAAHQLVLACRLTAGQRAQVRRLAMDLAVGGRVLLAGQIDDPTLVALYQSTALFVFPSLYEGYGLPVAEAMACGAPVVGSNTSATAELVAVAGQFDPRDPASMAGAIRAALEDPTVAGALRAASARPAPSWDGAGRRAAAVYEELLARPWPGARAGRRRLRVALVTPLPPQPTGVAVYSERLLAALVGVAGDRLEVDVFVDALEGGIRSLGARPRAPLGVAVHPVEHLERVEAARGGYDVLVYAIGNSEFHTGALGLALRRSGIVLAHDVRLPQLYAFAAHHGVLPKPFGECFAAMYPGAPAPLDPLLIPPSSLNALPQPMARDLIGGSLVFLTTSAAAAELARGDARPGEEGAVGVLVHACRSLPFVEGEPDLVATFGVVNPTKDTGRLLEAFAKLRDLRPAARLVLVGYGSEPDLAAVRTQAARLGVGGAVTATGQVSDAEWLAWLGRASLAVQLRRVSNGEFSGAVAEALSAGVPTMVAAVGPAGDLPEDAAERVPPSGDPRELAARMDALLGDPERRTALSAAARAFAATRSFEAVARELAGWIERAAGMKARGDGFV